jgi:hypothetical protein
VPKITDAKKLTRQTSARLRGATLQMVSLHNCFVPTSAVTKPMHIGTTTAGVPAFVGYSSETTKNMACEILET